MDRYCEKIMKSREAEAEIKAQLRRKRMQELAILREENKRLMDENRSLTDKLDEIGKAYNEQVSLAGFLEEKNSELEAERAAMIKQLDEDIEEYSKSIDGDLYKGMQAGYMVLRSRLLREEGEHDD